MPDRSNDIVIRTALAADAPDIARILRQTRRHSLPYLPDLHTPAEDIAFIAETVLAEDDVRVAERGGRIVGFCAYREGWLDHLYVHPEHHNKGIGTSLLACAKEANGRLELWAFQRNAPAIAFYERHGFAIVETTDGSGNEEKEPDARLLWQKSETSLADRIIDHYERHARAWDTDRQAGTGTDHAWLERFAGRLQRGAHVLDLGCGSGRPVAAFMVECGFKVTGVDSSPTMISLCRERLPGETWIVADMRNLALDQTFDGILAWDSFFHLNAEDQRLMFDVFDRHAGTGALLMFNAGPAEGEAIGDYRGDPLFHASLAPGEYQSLLARHRFEILDHAVNDPEAGGRTVWLCRRQE